MYRAVVAGCLVFVAVMALAEAAPADSPPALWEIAGGGLKLVQAEGMPDGDIVLLGNLAIELERTALQDVARAVGAGVAQSGDAAGALAWICLHVDGPDADARLWLTSDEMGGGNINEAVLASLPASSAPTSGCPAAKADLAVFRLPGNLRLGESVEALRSRLGKPSYDQEGVTAFTRWFGLFTAAPVAGECQLGQSVWVKAEQDKVVAISVGRTSAC
jgi:hypothetical protein